MTKALGVLVLGTGLMAGCGKGTGAAVGDRASQCEAIRTAQVPVQERKVKKAVEMTTPEHQAEIAAEGATEIEQYKAKFVGVCTSADARTFACFHDEAAGSAPSKECKELLRDVWRTIYSP